MDRGSQPALMIRGGHVLDPSTGIDDIVDIRIAGSRIDAIARDLAGNDNVEVLDARGCYVVPGLIDSHAHVYAGVGEMGITPDEIGVGSGVTTIVDAGSAGWATFEGFREYVVSRASTRVLGLLHLSSIGLVMGSGGCELSDDVMINEDRIAATIEANRDLIVGIKVRACRAAVRALGLEPLRIARHVARRVHLPLHVHIGETDPVPGQGGPPSIADVVSLLDPGDVLTHMYTAHPGGVLDANRRVIPAVREAYARGVLFDSAHGLKNLSFENVQRLTEQGIEPFTISTDGHRLNRDGPVYDLPTTMAKFLALGFSLKQVVTCTTSHPARAYGRATTLGALEVGREADLSVLRVVDEPWTAVDSMGMTLQAAHGIEPVVTIRSGGVVKIRPAKRPYGADVRRTRSDVARVGV
jgi:dihydroorotase